MSETELDELEVVDDEELLRILLIEDNPGDARLIEEMLRNTEELAQRVSASDLSGRTPTIAHTTRLEEGVAMLQSDPADVVLLDLNLPDCQGLESLERVHEVQEAVPVVVLTGVRDQQVGVDAIQRGAQDFLVKDEVTRQLLVRTIYHAIERARQERDRRRQRVQLESFNQFNRIGHDITHAVITTETRLELEQRVCDRLAEADAYRLAWIGEVNPGSDRIVSKVSAGVGEEYIEEIEITVDEDDPAGQGPSGTAIRTGAVQVMNDIQSDPAFEPWREAAIERGYRSSAAIPIVHDNLVYGVLNVYAETPRAFTKTEVPVLARIGNVVAHAITAIERKDALVSDSVVELEFRVGEMAEPLIDLTASNACAISIEQFIWSDETLLAYGSASAVSQEAFFGAVEETDGIAEGRVLSARREEFEFELLVPTAFSLFETIATHSGRVSSATIEDGEFRFVVELPRGRDTRQMIERIRDERDDVGYLAKRTTERGDRSSIRPQSVLEEALTEKQRAALETAYHAGYFDWPRESTGEEVAERLGIAPATFNQHLRTAERKFFDSVLGK